jgi:ribonucleoside-diphosphate reductase beta chain
MSVPDMRSYLEYVADRRLAHLGMAELYGSKNPFGFMELQYVQELSNFFERRVSDYQDAVGGQFSLTEDF